MKTQIVGILNLSRDSFSGDFVEDSKSKLLELIRDGADIIDIGAQSTRPNYKEISIQEEIDRLKILPELIKISSVPISIDTYRSEVAEFAFESGAKILNDIRGLRDSKMIDVAKKFDRVIAMHDGSLSTMKDRFRAILNSGIDRSKIILDPGIGFGKSAEEDLKTIANLDELRTIDGEKFPMLLACSRKSFIGKTLGLDVANRVEATGAACVIAICSGVEFLRVHDVQAISRMAKMTDAILNSR